MVWGIIIGKFKVLLVVFKAQIIVPAAVENKHCALAFKLFIHRQKEALKITDTDTPEKAADVLSNYFEKVIVKLDKDGCLGMENGKKFYVSQVDDFKHVDSTGAGDAFLAGFIYGLYHEKSFLYTGKKPPVCIITIFAPVHIL